jgi:hypothetical protein
VIVPKVLIGVFSVNEGRNLERLVGQLLSESTAIDASIVLLDESTDADSLAVVAHLLGEKSVRLLGRTSSVRGKVPALNRLFAEFLAGPAQILLHFDADQSLRAGCVPRMVEEIRSGADLAAAVNYALPGRNWFERAVRLSLRPGELERATGSSSDPLLGHNGAYSRRAVEQLAPVPEHGVNEELFLLCLAEARGLRRVVVTGAAAEFRLPANPRDYVRGAQRVQNRAAAFLAWCARNDPTGELGELAQRVATRVYRLPRGSSMLQALREDPVASLLLPEVLGLKIVVRLRRHPSDSDLWDPVVSSKGLAG